MPASSRCSGSSASTPSSACSTRCWSCASSRAARRSNRLRPRRADVATVWFILLAGMIATYVVLDGFDLGAGAMHRLLARGEKEREQLHDAIGPIWDGNEV